MGSVKVADLNSFVLQVLDRCGVSPEDAQTTADVLVTTDAWGVFTHGTKWLLTYTRRLRGKGLKPRGRPRILSEGPAWASVDGDCALAMVTGVFAMNLAIAKAASSGVALVVVRDSCHFGAAGYYASVAAARGQIGFAVGNAEPRVAAPGSLGPVLGSNPLAFAAPSGREGTLVFDIATAAAAGGKITAAAAAGKFVPGEWLVDSNGQPTTDPNLFLQGKAFLAPVAGHKGYGLALMVEVLAGALSGAGIRGKVGMCESDPPEQSTDYGHAFLSINPDVFLGPDIFPGRMDELFSGIRACPAISKTVPVKIPGEIEQEKMLKALSEGIDLPDNVVEILRLVAEENGLPVPGFLNQAADASHRPPAIR